MDTDDPRALLKAAGVECAEVQAFMDAYGRHEWTNLTEADAAILALARLVAKYKWQRDEAINLTADSEDEATELLEDIEQGWRVESEARP